MKVKRGHQNSSDGPANKKTKNSKSFSKNKQKHSSSRHKKPHQSPRHKKGHQSAKNKGQKPKNNDQDSKSPKYEKPTAKNNDEAIPKPKKSKFSNKVGKPNLDRPKNVNKDQTGTDTTGEKPDWLEYKKQQKELREKRRAKKLEDTYEVAIQAKQIGEKLRRSNLSADMQEKLTKKLHDLIQNQYAKMIFAHDLSRVIQWQIKYCNPDIQLAIVQELKPQLREMFYSKYAKNVVRTLLKKGSESVKKSVLQVCTGHVVKLCTNVLAAPIFEKIYVEVASETEKSQFKQEFYGDMYKNSKDPNVKTLTDVFKNSQDMKSATLSGVKANLIRILNKNLINSTLVHTVLYEYLSNCSKEDRTEIMALARPLIADLSQTRDGAKVGNLCIWHGTNKDRKLIMKSLKEHIKDIITSEHGHLMIIALLDSVDDTVLLKKILLQEVLNNLSDIVLNDYGRRVILYIVARRDTHYFHPALVEYLKEGDGNETSKKPADIREKELLDNMIDNLLENIVQDSKMWLSNGQMQLVTLAILKASRGDKPKVAFETIAKFITDSNSMLLHGTEVVKAVEDPGLHMILKKIIQMDKKRLEDNELTFGEVLLEHLTHEVIEFWVDCNRSCFLLVLLVENESEKVVSELKSKLKNISKLKSKKTKGATILLTKLK
ncbi:pumilio homolog 3 [Nasonia vitripennis]|uniref:PUM-HD domain-containing protein n=1 Tax=Nasonia vitripennis TaxID=7425 RepID=A0A7M7G4R2_NASVI|nr:pumilio homolog 3 [Nasonia vitripennis]XP_008217423.1 pumilio homolog 3 [Nasonia vitripennis]XP_016842100.1 pumilio homolog 3 [Nasonia vitripennis]